MNRSERGMLKKQSWPLRDEDAVGQTTIFIMKASPIHIFHRAHGMRVATFRGMGGCLHTEFVPMD